jgi:hypothetical protein
MLYKEEEEEEEALLFSKKKRGRRQQKERVLWETRTLIKGSRLPLFLLFLSLSKTIMTKF